MRQQESAEEREIHRLDDKNRKTKVRQQESVEEREIHRLHDKNRKTTRIS